MDTSTPSELWPYFESHRFLRGVLDSALTGATGAVTVYQDAANTMATVEAGCYVFIGGEPVREGIANLRSLPVGTEIIPGERSEPIGRLVAEQAVEVMPRPMTVLHWTGEALTVPRPPKGLHCRQLVTTDAEQFGHDLEPHPLQLYTDAESFLGHGFGFGVFQGAELISHASSYSCAHSVEICVSTRRGHRGRGLAHAAAARMVEACVRRGLAPEWSASNPVSIRLAERLGFERVGVCNALLIGPEDR